MTQVNPEEHELNTLDVQPVPIPSAEKQKEMGVTVWLVLLAAALCYIGYVVFRPS